MNFFRKKRTDNAEPPYRLEAQPDYGHGQVFQGALPSAQISFRYWYSR